MICNSNEGLQKCTDGLKATSEAVGLRFNNKKCEVMSNNSVDANIKLEQEAVKVSNSFTYLGSKIVSNGSTTCEIKVRIGKANAQFGKLTNIFKSKHLNTQTKLRIYNATIVPIVLYGSETWHLYSNDSKKLNAFHRKCLRKILGIAPLDKVRNSEVMKRTGMREMTDVVMERRLRWFERVARMKNNRLPKKIMKWKPPGKRSRGRPKLT